MSASDPENLIRPNGVNGMAEEPDVKDAGTPAIDAGVLEVDGKGAGTPGVGSTDGIGEPVLGCGEGGKSSDAGIDAEEAERRRKEAVEKIIQRAEMSRVGSFSCRVFFFSSFLSTPRELGRCHPYGFAPCLWTRLTFKALLLERTPKRSYLASLPGHASTIHPPNDEKGTQS